MMDRSPKPMLLVRRIALLSMLTWLTGGGVLEIPSATDTTKMVGLAKARFLQGEEATMP
jgi:hypothetical protein